MFFFWNRTLEDKLKRPLSPNDAREIFFQILEGVKHIHQNEVVHRDLSTKNIFFDKHGVAKIGDFGLGKFFLVILFVIMRLFRNLRVESTHN